MGHSSRPLNWTFVTQEEEQRLAAERNAAKEREAAAKQKEAAAKQVNQRERTW